MNFTLSTYNPSCRLCPAQYRAKHSTITINGKPGLSTSYASLQFFSMPKSKTDTENMPCEFVKASRSISGTRITVKMDCVYSINYLWKAYSRLSLHIEHIDSGHGLFHWFHKDCYSVGFSEVNYAHFSNWILLLFESFLALNLKYVDVLPKDHERHIRRMMSSLIFQAADSLWGRLEYKQREPVSNNTHRKQLNREQFYEYISDALNIGNMFELSVDSRTIERLASQSAKEYWFHYKYHIELNPNTDKLQTLYSPIMEHKVYGRKIRL